MANKKESAKVIKAKLDTKAKPKGKKRGKYKTSENTYKKIDWKTVDKLCEIQCLGEEIASILEIDYDTFNLACKREKKMKFTEYFKQKSAGGKRSLRRKQYKTAVNDGNPTMLIWLGKQWLGQTDKKELDVTSNGDNISPTVIEIVAPSMGKLDEKS